MRARFPKRPLHANMLTFVDMPLRSLQGQKLTKTGLSDDVQTAVVLVVRRPGSSVGQVFPNPRPTTAHALRQLTPNNSGRISIFDVSNAAF
jgi:hypothetical protein